MYTYIIYCICKIHGLKKQVGWVSYNHPNSTDHRPRGVLLGGSPPALPGNALRSDHRVGWMGFRQLGGGFWLLFFFLIEPRRRWVLLDCWESRVLCFCRCLVIVRYSIMKMIVLTTEECWRSKRCWHRLMAAHQQLQYAGCNDSKWPICGDCECQKLSAIWCPSGFSHYPFSHNHGSVEN